VVTSTVAFDRGLDPGPLTRGALHEACSTSANAGVTEMSGAQLRELVAIGLDRAFAADTPRAHRGRRRGLLHLSGAEVRDGNLRIAGQPVQPERHYRVARSDWELDTYGGYAKPEWELQIRYDMPYILREIIEEHLERHPVVTPPAPRIDGGLA
jgi:2',3'-cyclic-nucleotide 2'-phosphodiesterase (5'-nucleotidase family)